MENSRLILDELIKTGSVEYICSKYKMKKNEVMSMFYKLKMDQLSFFKHSIGLFKKVTDLEVENLVLKSMLNMHIKLWELEKLKASGVNIQTLDK